MVAFVAILWGTDAVPSYLTSLCVPLLVVLLRIMCVPRELRLASEKDNLLVRVACGVPVPARTWPVAGICAASLVHERRALRLDRRHCWRCQARRLRLCRSAC